MFSCNQVGDKSFEQANAYTADAVGATDSVKLVKKADLRFKVKDVEQNISEINKVVQEFGGVVMQQSFNSVELSTKELKLSDDSLLSMYSYRPEAVFELKIPSEHLTAFLQKIVQSGYYTQHSLFSMEDRSLDYLMYTMFNQNRSKVLADDKTKLKGDQTIWFNDDVVRNVIHNKQTDHEVQFSVVRLETYQNALVRKEVYANSDLSVYTLPVGQRFLIAFESGWDLFVGFLIGLTHLWLFILISVVGICIYKNRKRLRISRI